MKRRFLHLSLLAVGLVPILVYSEPQVAAPQAKGPLAEEVYKDIKVFKGVPASDIIPAMEFMCASMNMRCTGCHDADDYAKDNQNKETSRKMVLMQREINERHFNGTLEVTCNTCHNGKDHPDATPIPEGLNIRHIRIDEPPKVADIFAKHTTFTGKDSAVQLTGTLTAPDLITHDMETLPMELIQDTTGRFKMVSGMRKTGFDGKTTWYDKYPLDGESAAVFMRLGRSFRGDLAFAGLDRTSVAGRNKIGTTNVTVVRGTRTAFAATEELWFDNKTGNLLRTVNIKRSSIGVVISMIDYSDYKEVGGVTVPMKMVATFPGGEKWTMEYKEAKAGVAVTDATFAIGG